MKRFVVLHFNKLILYHTLLRKYEYFSNRLETSNSLEKCFLGMPFLFYYYRFKSLGYQLGFTIHKNVFGPGLSIRHYGAIVVNPNARIGRNCVIHSGVNIGETNGKAPFIGNNAYLGPGAKIWGDIKLGNNIRIGANAVVFKSYIEDNITLVGIPARKIQRND